MTRNYADHLRRGAARLLALRGGASASHHRHHPHHQPLLLLSSPPATPPPTIASIHTPTHAIRALHAATEAATASWRRGTSTSSAPSSSSSSSPRRSSAAAAPRPEAARAALEYCARLVRQHDPDSFAWAVLLPKEERARILALRALNVETLLIPSSAVRRSAGDGAQAMLRIRYQWWRDAVRAAMEAPAVAEAREDEEDDGEVETEDDDNQEEAGTTATTAPTPSASRRARLSPKTTPPTPPAHPVVTALWAARASAGPRLQRYPLRRLIDAREREALSAAAGEPPPLRLSDLEAHAEATHAQLLYAQLAAIGGGEGKSNNNSSAADHAASHAGKAVGLAMALRGLPYAAAQRRCVLPLEVCASAGLSQEDLFRRASAIESGRQPSPEEWSPKADAALRDAVLEVASRAVGHLQEARALAKGGGGGGGNGRASSSSSSFGKGQAHALLPAVAADLYLQALERTAQFDVFHPALRPPPTTTKKGAEEPPPPPPPLGAGLGVSPLRYLLSLRWHAWRGTF